MTRASGSRSRNSAFCSAVLARSADTTIAVGDEGTHGSLGMRKRCVAAQHGVRFAMLWHRYAAHRLMDAIRGFLEDSSPPAIVVTALRAWHVSPASPNFQTRRSRALT